MNTHDQYAQDCAAFVARTALKSAETMDTDHRLLIQDGILTLFPQGSPEWTAAKESSDAIHAFKQSQLRLFQHLDT